MEIDKKDPNAAISEPVTPITWWIENTTPITWRETIKEGVLAWNKAFESRIQKCNGCKSTT